MIDNIRHLSILRQYIIEVEGNRIDSEKVQVWLVGVIGCLENAVYNGEVTDSKIIGDISNFIANYYRSLDEVSDVDNDFVAIYTVATQIIDDVINHKNA